MTCSCKKTKEITTSNDVPDDFLPATGLDLTEKIDLNYNNTDSTKYPNDNLEDLKGAGEPFPTNGMYSYGKEPPHEPYLGEFVPCDTYCPVQEIWLPHKKLNILEAFSEEDRKRVPKGDPSGKGGQWVKGSAAGDKSDASGEEKLSQTKEWRAKQEYYGRKRQEYAAYDELGDDVGNKDQIRPDSAPNDYHRATAYRVLELYPDMDEETMIENAWKIDLERAKHQQNMDALAPQLKQAVAGIEGAVVYNRVKTRFKTLEKMGRKRKYTDPAQMGDISGYMIVVPSLQDVSNARNKSNTAVNIDPEKTEDTNEAPKDGYRAVHEEIVLPDGTRGELQFKTARQKTWAGYAHDNTYKPDPYTETGRLILDNMTTFQEYNQAYSEYYHQLDIGNTAAIAPPCPDMIRNSIGCLPP